jgi:hypothetical protein
MRTMLQGNLRIPLKAILGAAVILAGCAPFDHQPSTQEPHAVVSFAGVSDPFPDQPIVKSFDGHSVKVGREYRVQPGKHEWVCRVVDVSIEAADSAIVLSTKKTEKSTTTVFVSGVATYSDVRQARYVTNTLTVEAGWRYEVDGNGVMKRLLQMK